MAASMNGAQLPPPEPEVQHPCQQTAMAPEPTLMRRARAICLACVAGLLLVAQNGVNTNLRQHAVRAPFPAACVSFTVGLVSASLTAVVHSPRCGPTTLRQAPWYAYTGGLMGPVYVVAAILLSSRLGFAVFQLCAIAGQLTSSFVCDTLGLLRLRRRKPTVLRTLALLATMCGTVLTSTSVKVQEKSWLLVFYCASACFAGFIFPVQACVNAIMQEHVLTPFRATVVSFSGGTLVLLTISVVLTYGAGQPLVLSSGRPWMWTGGLCGATIVTCNIVGVPTLGAAAFSTIFLASQLTAAFTFDCIGAFGFPAMQVDLRRIGGVLLTVISAVYFQLQTAPPENPKCPANGSVHEDVTDGAPHEEVEGPQHRLDNPPEQSPAPKAGATHRGATPTLTMATCCGTCLTEIQVGFAVALR